MYEEKIAALRKRVKDSALDAVEELVKILEEPILGNTSIAPEGKKQKSGDIEPEKMRAAASAKRLAYDDAMYILSAIEKEEGMVVKKAEEIEEVKIPSPESRAKK